MHSQSPCFALALSPWLLLACGGPQTTPTTTAPGPAASATPSAAPKPEPVASAAAAASSAPSAAGSTTLRGKLRGKDFVVESAHVKKLDAFGTKVSKPGSVLLKVANEPGSCTEHAEKVGDTHLSLVIPWTAGATVDVKTFKEGKDPEASASVFLGNRTDVWNWKATGTIEVLVAPRKAGEVGRVRFETKSGTDTLSGEIDVKLCSDLP